MIFNVEVNDPTNDFGAVLQMQWLLAKARVYKEGNHES